MFGVKQKTAYEEGISDWSSDVCSSDQPDQNVVQISVIGVGMRSHAGVDQRMFKALSDNGINIQVISTSEIKISVLVKEKYLELACRALHTDYGLDAS